MSGENKRQGKREMKTYPQKENISRTFEMMREFSLETKTKRLLPILKNSLKRVLED